MNPPKNTNRKLLYDVFLSLGENAFFEEPILLTRLESNLKSQTKNNERLENRISMRFGTRIVMQVLYKYFMFTHIAGSWIRLQYIEQKSTYFWVNVMVC